MTGRGPLNDPSYSRYRVEQAGGSGRRHFWLKATLVLFIVIMFFALVIVTLIGST